jgi:hypothetical protein
MPDNMIWELANRICEAAAKTMDANLRLTSFTDSCFCINWTSFSFRWLPHELASKPPARASILAAASAIISRSHSAQCSRRTNNSTRGK